MKKNKKPTTIAFCGGHHTSSLPIIDALASDSNYRLIFIGRKRTFKDDENDSLEYIDVTERNLPFYDLKTSKFYKSNIFSFFKIIFGFFHAFHIIVKEDVRLVVSFGGYIAVPVVIASFILRRRIITHEQTVVTGFGNLLISKFADRVLLTWPSSVKYFDSSKVVVIGLPLRKSFYQSSEIFFPVTNNMPTIFITCGKTGSHIINKFILDNLKFFLANFNLIHQAGDYSVTKDFQNLQEKYENIKKSAKGAYFLYKFMNEKEVNSAFRHCDFTLSRSGAHTIYEILHFKKPAIMIPIPWVSKNEQYLNAKLVYDSGLGLILEENNLTLENFKTYVERILLREFSLKDPKIEEVIKLNTTEKFINEIKDQLS